MAIAFTKYVDITSGVGGVSQVAERDLIARLFTQNSLVPSGGVIEFTDAASVLAYFGATSQEYLRALFYFNFVSQKITSPEKISYAFWSDTDTPPAIFGDKEDKFLSDFTSIADGEFTLTLGTITEVVGPCNFTGAASLADIASILQTEINSANVDPLFASATVVYDATRGAFVLVGGATGEAAVNTAVSGGGTDILTLIGWVNTGLVTADGAIFTNGIDGQTVTEALTESADASDNFGSFAFVDALTDQQIEDAAIWNSSENVKYMFMFDALEADAAAFFNDLKDYGGTGLTINAEADEYPEMLPMALLASTRYNRRNSTYNYMFQQADGLTASVTDTQTSDALDTVRANYYGQTQRSGRLLEFYQRGSLYGSATDPIAMNVYANEIWLKDACGAILMNALLAIKISANKTGRSQLTTLIQDPVDRALLNGTISVGKPLTTVQKVFIDDQAGYEGAWQQVQNVGYWFEVLFEQFVNTSGENEFKAVYTLIYSKDDAIRSIDGTHILI